LKFCPGFGQDRVNFHRTPGRGTARRADPTWPNRAGYSIPCAVMLGSGRGKLGRQELTRGSGARGRGGSGERLCGLCGLCCVFPFSVSLLFLFPLFAVLLNCPYPDPPVSACFFPFFSAPQWGEGRPCGTFVAGCSQSITDLYGLQSGFCVDKVPSNISQCSDICCKGGYILPFRGKL